MKALLFALLFSTAAFTASAQDKTPKASAPDKNKPLLNVEASCGQCRFGLEGKGCDLAVRLDGKAYFVDGSNIDDHGDAHAEDGFCNAVRKAQVQGEVKEGRFYATYFQLLPEPKTKEKTKH